MTGGESDGRSVRQGECLRLSATTVVVSVTEGRRTLRDGGPEVTEHRGRVMSPQVESLWDGCFHVIGGGVMTIKV